MKFSMESTLTDVLASEEATAVVEKYCPGFTDNPMLGMAMSMTMQQIAGNPMAGVEQAVIPKIAKELEAL